MSATKDLGIIHSETSPWLVFASLTALAVLSWGAILLVPDAYYWDDWAIVATPDTLNWAREAGLPWIGPVFLGLGTLGPWAFKVIAIVTTAIVGYLSYLIAGRGLGLSHPERWILAALIVTLPLHATRAIPVLNFYAWSITLFFLAWYLLVRKQPDSPGRIRYVVASVLLFGSFTMASLLPFALLPAAHLALLAIDRTVPLWRGLIGFVAKFWYVLITPVLFWIVRTLFFKPYGLYEDYNSLRLFATDANGIGSLALTLLVVSVLAIVLFFLCGRKPAAVWIRGGLSLGALAGATSALSLFIYVTRVSTAPYAKVVPVLLAACAIVFAVRAVQVVRQRSDDARGIVPIVAVGIVALAVAMLPYLMVNKLPSFQNWETRHQILMPFGTAMLIVAAFRASGVLQASKRVVATIAISLTLALALISATISLSLVVDWNKQKQIISAISQSAEIESASTVVFVDEARELSYDQRPHAFYEYTGWLWSAFGDKTRIGIDSTSVPAYVAGEFDPAFSARSRYGIDDFVPSADGVLVTILPLADTTWWGLLWGEQSIELATKPIPDLAAF